MVRQKILRLQQPRDSVNDATTGNATFLWVDDTGGNGHLQITITGDSTSLEFK